MSKETSRDSESNDSQPRRAVVLNGGGTWASPPSGSRVTDRRVPAAASEGAFVWLTAPSIDPTVGADSIERESVEWTEIVEDLQRDVVEAEVVKPETELVRQQRPEAPAAPAEQTVAAEELVRVRSGEVNVAGALVAVDALLTINLEPGWPGNVHVFEITIDARDGSFTGVATPSSSVAGETIRGVFSDGCTDFDITAAHPAPAQYSWVGTGPLRGFAGADSRGNVWHNASATVTDMSYVMADVPTDEPTMFLPAQSAVEAEPDAPPAADQWFDEADAADVEVADTAVEDQIGEPRDIAVMQHDEELEHDTNDDVAGDAAPAPRPRRVRRPRGRQVRRAERRAAAEASAEQIAEPHEIVVAEPEAPETATEPDIDHEVPESSVAEQIADAHDAVVTQSDEAPEQGTGVELTNAAAPGPRRRGRRRARRAERRAIAEASVDTLLTTDEQHELVVAEPDAPETAHEHNTDDAVHEARPEAVVVEVDDAVVAPKADEEPVGVVELAAVDAMNEAPAEAVAEVEARQRRRRRRRARPVIDTEDTITVTDEAVEEIVEEAEPETVADESAPEVNVADEQAQARLAAVEARRSRRLRRRARTVIDSDETIAVTDEAVEQIVEEAEPEPVADEIASDVDVADETADETADATVVAVEVRRGRLRRRRARPVIDRDETITVAEEAVEEIVEEAEPELVVDEIASEVSLVDETADPTVVAEVKVRRGRLRRRRARPVIDTEETIAATDEAVDEVVEDSPSDAVVVDDLADEVVAREERRRSRRGLRIVTARPVIDIEESNAVTDEAVDAGVVETPVAEEIAEPEDIAVAQAEEAPEQDTDDRLPRRVQRPRGRLGWRRAQPFTVGEVPVDLDFTTVEQLEVALAEAEVVPEVSPEPAVVDLTVEAPAVDIRDHEANCRCLACSSRGFEAVPVTEGPLAGKAFYFRARRPSSDSASA